VGQLYWNYPNESISLHNLFIGLANFAIQLEVFKETEIIFKVVSSQPGGTFVPHP
jgi:hypothetical protein